LHLPAAPFPRRQPVFSRHHGRRGRRRPDRRRPRRRRPPRRHPHLDRSARRPAIQGQRCEPGHLERRHLKAPQRRRPRPGRRRRRRRCRLLRPGGRRCCV
ncbi:hypothetical protein HK405_010687, partial [Cladochytrium tenue]